MHRNMGKIFEPNAIQNVTNWTAKMYVVNLKNQIINNNFHKFYRAWDSVRFEEEDMDTKLSPRCGVLHA